MTVELSMYPLSEAYEAHVLKFIEDLKRNKEIVVRVNETSTHLFGDFDLVFDLLREAIRESYNRYDKNIFVVKVLGGDLQGSAAGL